MVALIDRSTHRGTTQLLAVGAATPYLPAQDSYLMLLRGYQGVNDFPSDFYKEKSAIRCAEHALSLPPEPPATAILTMAV